MPASYIKQFARYLNNPGYDKSPVAYSHKIAAKNCWNCGNSQGGWNYLFLAEELIQADDADRAYLKQLFSKGYGTHTES